MSDIDAVSQYQYAAGTDPIDWACYLVELYIESWDEIRTARRYNPNAWPVYQLPLTTEVIARQILGRLLDAGWTPPAIERGAA